MADQMLTHYGVLGMKWGVRRTPAQLARARGQSGSSSSKTTKKPTKPTAKTSKGETKEKSVKEMSDDEIRQKISRLQLEKQYRDLTKGSSVSQTNKGREFVSKVIARSGENIATQFTTYVMGKAVNKAFSGIFKEEVVNPKKGQKDK